MTPYSRTELLLGSDAMKKLKNAKVAVFGLGGVGGYVVEALARSGVGALVLVDHDTISTTNINRQILATASTVGKSKAETAKMRVLEIDPNIAVEARMTFYGPDTADTFDFSGYDYVVDAIDTVTGKLALVTAAKAAGTPIICAMGAGNKLDPTRFEVADLAKTSVCPLAKVMRVELRKRGIEHLKVVYSREEPVTPPMDAPALPMDENGNPKRAPGSVSFVPAVMGLIMAGEIIRDLAARAQE